MWWDGQGNAHKTGILAETPSGEKISFDPPNKAELDTAKDLIKTSEKLDDLESDEKRIAVMILANDIRQLQERLGKSYEEAAAMAIEGLEKKVGEEPDFFSGTDSKLNLGSDGLTDNEYQGIDGHVYVVGDDGSFRRKD